MSSKPTRTAPKFVKPTIEEVRAYCQEKGIDHVDPEKFWHHYESCGWKRGKTPITLWKSAVHTWKRNDYDRPTAPVTETSTRFIPKPRPVDEEPVTTDEMMRLFYEGTQ